MSFSASSQKLCRKGVPALTRECMTAHARYYRNSRMGKARITMRRMSLPSTRPLRSLKLQSTLTSNFQAMTSCSYSEEASGDPMHIESCSIYNDRIRRRLSMLVLSENDSPCQDDKRASGFRIFFCGATEQARTRRIARRYKARHVYLCIYIYIYATYEKDQP